MTEGTKSREVKHHEIVHPCKAWWPGDSRVEQYMIGVSQALNRREITGEARTDIYNRACEAVYQAIIGTEKKKILLDTRPG